MSIRRKYLNEIKNNFIIFIQTVVEYIFFKVSFYQKKKLVYFFQFFSWMSRSFFHITNCENLDNCFYLIHLSSNCTTFHHITFYSILKQYFKNKIIDYIFLQVGDFFSSSQGTIFPLFHFFQNNIWWDKDKYFLPKLYLVVEK